MSREELALSLVKGKKFMEGQKKIGGGADFLGMLPFWCVVHFHGHLYGIVQFVASHTKFADFAMYENHGAVQEKYKYFWCVGSFVEFPVPVSLAGVEKKYTGCLIGLWTVKNLRPCEPTFQKIKEQVELVFGVYA
jgi:hypothetical protein